MSSLVRQPGERRVREVLSRAMRVVAAERERTVATVVSAVALTDAQTERLGAALAARLWSDDARVIRPAEAAA